MKLPNQAQYVARKTTDTASPAGVTPSDDDFCQCCGANVFCRYGCKCDCETGQICNSE